MDSDAEKRKQNKCMGAPRGCTFFCRVSLRIETDADVLQAQYRGRGRGANEVDFTDLS